MGNGAGNGSALHDKSAKGEQTQAPATGVASAIAPHVFRLARLRAAAAAATPFRESTSGARRVAAGGVRSSSCRLDSATSLVFAALLGFN